MNCPAIKAIQFTLVALIEVLISVIEHQTPRVLSHDVKPATDRQWQALSRLTQVAQRIALATHTAFGHFKRGLFRNAGTPQAGQLQLHVIDALHSHHQVCGRPVLLIQQTVQGFKSQLQGLFRRLRQAFRQCLFGCLHRSSGDLSQQCRLLGGIRIDRRQCSLKVFSNAGKARVLAHFN